MTEALEALAVGITLGVAIVGVVYAGFKAVFEIHPGLKCWFLGHNVESTELGVWDRSKMNYQCKVCGRQWKTAHDVPRCF